MKAVKEKKGYTDVVKHNYVLRSLRSKCIVDRENSFIKVNTHSNKIKTRDKDL